MATHRHAYKHQEGLRPFASTRRRAGGRTGAPLSTAVLERVIGSMLQRNSCFPPCYILKHPWSLPSKPICCRSQATSSDICQARNDTCSRLNARIISRLVSTRSGAVSARWSYPQLPPPSSDEEWLHEWERQCGCRKSTSWWTELAEVARKSACGTAAS